MSQRQERNKTKKETVIIQKEIRSDWGGAVIKTVGLCGMERKGNNTVSETVDCRPYDSLLIYANRMAVFEAHCGPRAE